MKSEIPPSFPGGNDSLKKWVEGYLSDSLQLQFDTAQASFEFVVTSQGNAIDISLTSTNSAIADQYWLFAMDRMPKWNPGKIKGKDVFVKHSITLETIRRKS